MDINQTWGKEGEIVIYKVNVYDMNLLTNNLLSPLHNQKHLSNALSSK